MLGSWASSDLLTNLKTLLLPKKDARGLCVWQCLHKTRKKYDQLSCRTYCTACLFVCGEKTIVTVPQCWPQFVCTPGSAGACVCAGNRMGVCHGAVMLSRGKQWTLRVQIERALQHCLHTNRCSLSHLTPVFLLLHYERSVPCQDNRV